LTDQGKESLTKVLASISPTITSEMNGSLCSRFSEVEIKQAIFELPRNKIHRLDGYPIEFYQSF